MPNTSINTTAALFEAKLAELEKRFEQRIQELQKQTEATIERLFTTFTTTYNKKIDDLMEKNLKMFTTRMENMLLAFPPSEFPEDDNYEMEHDADPKDDAYTLDQFAKHYTSLLSKNTQSRTGKKPPKKPS